MDVPLGGKLTQILVPQHVNATRRTTGDDASDRAKSGRCGDLETAMPLQCGRQAQTDAGRDAASSDINAAVDQTNVNAEAMITPPTRALPSRPRIIIGCPTASQDTQIKSPLGNLDADLVDAQSAAEILSLVASGPADMVLLHLNAAAEDGIGLIEAIRAQSDVPVLAVAPAPHKASIDAFLDAGADDCVITPYDRKEFLARIRSLLRRAARAASASAHRAMATSGPAGNVDAYIFDAWSLELRRRQLLKIDGGSVELTPTEFDVLAMLVRQPGVPISREALVEGLNSPVAPSFSRSIDMHVGRLRKKIEQNPARPEMIKTIRGIGYVFTPEVTVRPVALPPSVFGSNA
jgi:two-component system, OmpR family, response regulator